MTEPLQQSSADDAALAADLDDFATSDLPGTAERGVFYADDVDWRTLADRQAQEDTANMLLRRRRRLVAEWDRISRLATAEMDRIAAWQEDRTAGLVKAVERLEESLEAFTRAVHADDPRKVTWTLPNGTLKLTKPRGKVTVDDEAALVEWARSNDHLDLLTLGPAKSALADLPRKEAEPLVTCDLNPEPHAECQGGERCKNPQPVADRFDLFDGNGEQVPGVTFVVPTERSFHV